MHTLHSPTLPRAPSYLTEPRPVAFLQRKLFFGSMTSLLLVMTPFAAGSCNLTLNTSHEDLFDSRLDVGTTVCAFVLHLSLFSTSISIYLSPDSLTLTREPEPEPEPDLYPNPNPN